MPENPSPTQGIVLKETRWLALLVIPILAAAFLILYITPDTGGEHFAWQIKPRMSSMMLGATYFTGVIYFSVVLRARYWHQVRLGLLPVALFATMLGVATILHWDKFNHSQFEFWLWVVLYWALPFVLVWAWLRNERHARPPSKLQAEVHISLSSRWILATLGVALGVTSLLLFFVPSLMAAHWPWTISALTSRITAAELGLFSFFMLEVAVVARWSEVRSLLFPQLISPIFFATCIIASWGDFDKSNPLTWLFIGFVLVVFVAGFPAMYFPMEARRKAAMASENINR